MPYTVLSDIEYGGTIPYTDWNTLVENVQSMEPTYDNSDKTPLEGTISTTSVALVAMDDSLQMEMETMGRPILFSFFAIMNASGAGYVGGFDVEVNGTASAGTGLYNVNTQTFNTTLDGAFYQYVLDDLPAGTYTFKAMWKVHTGTLKAYSADCHIRFEAMELCQ